MPKMKVHILSDVSDLSGVHHAGDEPELEEDRAQQYLTSGLAINVTGDVAPTAATLAPDAETATLPRAKPRG
jgi:hypothetical protein